MKTHSTWIQKIATTAACILGGYYLLLAVLAGVGAVSLRGLSWGGIEFIIVNTATGLLIISGWWAISEFICDMRRCGHIR